MDHRRSGGPGVCSSTEVHDPREEDEADADAKPETEGVVERARRCVAVNGEVGSGQVVAAIAEHLRVQRAVFGEELREVLSGAHKSDVLGDGWWQRRWGRGWRRETHLIGAHAFNTTQ